MERKVLFIKNDYATEAGARWFAQHIEPFREGIAVTLTAEAYFAHREGGGTPVTSGSLAVTHCGHKILDIESPEIPYKVAAPTKRYASGVFSIGGQKISIGFGGRGEVRESGWLPKYLYIKIER